MSVGVYMYIYIYIYIYIYMDEISGFGRSASEFRKERSEPGVRVGFGCGSPGCGTGVVPLGRNFFLGSSTVSGLVTVAVLRTRGRIRLASQFVGRIYNKGYNCLTDTNGGRPFNW